MEALIITAAIVLAVVVLMAGSILVVEFFDRLIDNAAKATVERRFNKHADEALTIANQK